jgi:hypothetical protein
MQDIIDKMYQDDFRPSQLSPRERRAYDALWDQAQTILDRLSEIEEIEEEEEDNED